jgi:pyruvate formate lyase activating enzyme
MKGVLFDRKHFAVHDGPGIRQTVFFKGCPLRCTWCHNPESQNSQPQKYTQTTLLDGQKIQRQKMVGYSIESHMLMEQILSDRVFYEESGGGVTFSGGEPCMQRDFLLELLKLCKNEGIHTAVDTCGYVNQNTFQQIAKQTNLLLYDLKLIGDKEHRTYTGVPVQPIIENLRWLDATGIPYRIRIPIIPSITDEPKNLNGLVTILNQLKNYQGIELMPFHNISQHKYDRFEMQNVFENQQSLSIVDLKPIVDYFADQKIRVIVNA